MGGGGGWGRKKFSPQFKFYNIERRSFKKLPVSVESRIFVMPSKYNFLTSCLGTFSLRENLTICHITTMEARLCALTLNTKQTWTVPYQSARLLRALQCPDQRQPPGASERRGLGRRRQQRPRLSTAETRSSWDRSPSGWEGRPNRRDQTLRRTCKLRTWHEDCQDRLLSKRTGSNGLFIVNIDTKICNLLEWKKSLPNQKQL